MSPLKRWLLAMMFLGATPAWCQARAEALLSEARAARSRLHYEDVLRLAGQALAAGDAERATLVSLWRLRAEAYAVLGLTDDAVRSFSRALELSPSEELSADTPPKIRRPFEQARRELGGKALEVRVASKRDAKGRVQTDIEVQNDTQALVGRFALRPLVPPGEVLVSSVPRISWRCAEAPCAHLLQVMDAQGNALVRLGTVDSPLIPLETAPPSPERGFFTRRWPWLGLTAALGLTTGYLAYRFAHAQSELGAVVNAPEAHTPAERAKWDGERRAVQPWLWMSALATGASGAVTVLVW